MLAVCPSPVPLRGARPFFPLTRAPIYVNMEGKRRDRGAAPERVDAPDRAVAARGEKGTVVWAEDTRGRMPAKEFVESLPEKTQKRVAWLFSTFADRWHLDKDKFKYETDGLHAFRYFQTRLLGAFRPGARFVVAHGITKQTDKMPPEAFARAARVLAEWDARQVDARRR